MSQSQLLAILGNPLMLTPILSTFISLIKLPIENLLPATAKAHDLFFVLLPLALGAFAGLLAGLAPAHPTALSVILSMLWSGAGGAGAVGTYYAHTRLRTTVAPKSANIPPVELGPATPPAGG